MVVETARPRRLAAYLTLAAMALIAAVACTAGDGAPATDGASPSAEAAPGEVRLEVGDDFDAVQQANPPGTTYVIATGLHRGQHVIPDDGDTFVGEPGAIVSGAVELDPAAFTARDGLWVMAGREEAPFTTDSGELHGQMEDGFARDAANHDLWRDDVRLQHVEALVDLDATGEWFFDYDADELWVADDPATATGLELAVVPAFARSPGARDVTIADLTLTRYASPAQHGVIHADGPDWHISDVVVQEAHGTGIVLGDGSVLEGSEVRDAGQMGVAAEDAGHIVVRDTEIAGNGQLRYRWNWERGGLKFKGTQDVEVLDSHVHDNDGPGIWFDIDNREVVIAGNLVEDNTVSGIFYEISFDGVIRDNEVYRNGLSDQAGPIGTGIFVSISTDVLVEGNTTAGNRFEVILVHADRSEEIGPGYGVEDVIVRDNDITMSNEGAVGFYVDTDETEYYTDRGNAFTGNTYTVDGCELCFRWGDLTDLAGWQAVGNDLEEGAPTPTGGEE